jgi:hypothetical protein
MADYEYRHKPYNNNLGVIPMEPVLESQPSPLPKQENGNIDGDEALMDLAQLEDLHNEAERMKALGNKHMAAQVRFMQALALLLNKYTHTHTRAQYWCNKFSLSHTHTHTLSVSFSFYPCTGIQQSLQCVFCRAAGVSGGPFVARLSFESIGSLAVAQEILGCGDRCPPCHCLGADLWQSPCAIGPIPLFFERFRWSGRCL